MNEIIFVFFVLVMIVFVYKSAKFLLVKKENKVIQKAKIDKISLYQVGMVWSPELLIKYYFTFNNVVYFGEDFLRIDHLLSEWEILLFDRNGYAVLRTEIGEFVGEEHIETFILSQTSDLSIEFNTNTLPDSKIFKTSRENKTLFQNLDIKFPWT
ncbi:MAG: hypothetical protein OEV78_09960 [Spirochaetia bacterium]|nr:hypothetical protein [Spirochaetia bacterium]